MDIVEQPEEFRFEDPPEEEVFLEPLPEGTAMFNVVLTRGLHLAGHYIEAGEKIGEVHALFGINPALLCANIGANMKLESQ